MNRRVLLSLCALAAVACAAFSYGLLVGKYSVFPYRQIVSIKDYLAGSPVTDDSAPQTRTLNTNLTLVRQRRFAAAPMQELVGWGGGITTLRDEVVGVDREGHFFVYKGSGEVEPLALELDLHKAEFLDYLERENIPRGQAERHFRVLDIQGAEIGGRAHVFVSYTYWHPEEAAKSIRVSRLVLSSLDELRTAAAGSHEWETVFESSPILRASEFPALVFSTNRTGGRLAMLDERTLLIGVGDLNLDGFDYPVRAPQEPGFSYGKIIAIDLVDLTAADYAIGVRNTQGLHRDSSGRIWETEHGPRGGDELNLIEPGGNYGWPLVTYGTNYNNFTWVLNPDNGEHGLHRRPIFAWVPSVGISSLISIENPESVWYGDLLVSSLNGSTIYRVKVDEGRAVLTEPIDIGVRIRDLLELEDGRIVLWTDEPSFIELEGFVSDDTARLEQFARSRNVFEYLSVCTECHSFQEGVSSESKSSLWGIYGDDIASTGFGNYSQALRDVRGEWTDRTLTSFINDPQAFAPGTTMPNLGVSMDDAYSLALLIRMNGFAE